MESSIAKFKKINPMTWGVNRRKTNYNFLGVWKEKKMKMVWRILRLKNKMKKLQKRTEWISKKAKK